MDFRVDELKIVNLDLIGNLEMLSFSVREWRGLMAYWLTGRIDKLVPGICKVEEN